MCLTTSTSRANSRSRNTHMERLQMANWPLLERLSMDFPFVYVKSDKTALLSLALPESTMQQSMNNGKPGSSVMFIDCCMHVYIGSDGALVWLRYNLNQGCVPHKS